jgi:hypothetical protein
MIVNYWHILDRTLVNMSSAVNMFTTTSGACIRGFKGNFSFLNLIAREVVKLFLTNVFFFIMVN